MMHLSKDAADLRRVYWRTEGLMMSDQEVRVFTMIESDEDVGSQLHA